MNLDQIGGSAEGFSAVPDDVDQREVVEREKEVKGVWERCLVFEEVKQRLLPKKATLLNASPRTETS